MGVFDLLFDALWSIGSSLGFIVVIVFVLMSAVKIVTEYQRLVVFRLGRLIGTKGPGLVIVIPFVDRVVRVDLRTVVLDVPVQEVITKERADQGERGGVFPRSGLVEIRRRGRKPHHGDEPALANDVAVGHRLRRSRRRAFVTREDQRGIAEDHR